MLHDCKRSVRPYMASLFSLAVLAGCAGRSPVPSLQPVSSLSATRAVGGLLSPGGDFIGCPYPSGDIYQTNISGVTPDPESNAYIASVISAPGGSGGFQAWINTQDINEASNSTPLLTVNPGNSYDLPFSPIPWALNFFIEKDGDHHSEVLQGQTCQYYEGYRTTFNPLNEILSMYNNEHIDLTVPFVRPATGALSTATGIPLGLLAVRPEELSAGVISHALGWNAVAGSLNGVAGAPCVNPAGYSDCTDGNRYDGRLPHPMPYGSHARLKATFDTSHLTPNVKIIATAMQTYGLYVYDTGCCNAIILAEDENGQQNWTSADTMSLGNISPSNFEIVPPPLDGQTSSPKHRLKKP